MRISVESRSSCTSRARYWAAGVILGIAGVGCAVDPNAPRECTGKTYSSYLSEITDATLAYEKRCGILDSADSRDSQRKTLFLASYPPFLTDIRDKAATGKRTGYDSTCFVNLLK